MTWGPSFTQRVADLVVHRGLDNAVGQALNECGNEQLLTQLERATDEDIADVSRLWRDQASTQQGGP